MATRWWWKDGRRRLVQVFEQGHVLAPEDPAPDEAVDGEDDHLSGEESEQNSFLGPGVLEIQAFGELHRTEHDGYADDLLGESRGYIGELVFCLLRVNEFFVE